MSATPGRLAAAVADRYRLERELGADRFVQEIKTTAALQHPHILPLFDSGTADGFLFYVMPFIDGETLRSKLDRETQLGIDEAVKITTAVADALDYAHRNGVIHRDIKPENILLHDGRPMVADFGIALAVSAAAGGRMTETGMSLGTPHYMSPEQATAEKEITARSDVYSLGTVLYEMLAGQPPHLGGSAQQIIMKIIAEDAQPVTALRKSVPANVAAAVGKALEKLPADRFDTAKAFAEALASPSFRTAATVAAGSPTALPPYRRTVGILATIATLAIALSGWALLRSPPEPPTTRQWIGLSLRRPGGAMPNSWSFNLAIASDGSAIVFSDSIDDRGTQQLFLKDAGSATAVPIPGTVGAENPFFSPDGEWIGFATERGLHRVPRNGGAPIRVSDSTRAWSSGAFSTGVWLDDGTMVFAGVDNRRLLRVDAQGGAEHEVLATDQLPPGAVIRLQGLPEGRGVLITVCTQVPCLTGELWMLDLRQDTMARLVSGVSSGWYLPTGHVLYGRADGTLYAQQLDVDRRELTGSALPVMTDLATLAGVPALALSPAGTMLYAQGGADDFLNLASSLVWVDRRGSVAVIDSALSLAISGGGGLSLSPDGSRLALVQNTGQGLQVFVKQMPDGPVTRLTFEGGSIRPVWAPGNRDLLFIGNREQALSVAVRRRADGTGGETVVAAEQTRPIQEILLSPDGAWLVYRTDNGSAGRGDILARRLTGDTSTIPLVATPAQEVTPAISPDGRWLAYVSDESGSSEVFVRPWPEVNSGKWQVSRQGGTEPQWGPSSRELFYRSSAQELLAAQVEAVPTFRVRETLTLFSVAAYGADPTHPMYAVSRDGRRFLFQQQNFTRQIDASRLILVEHWFTELRPILERR